MEQSFKRVRNIGGHTFTLSVNKAIAKNNTAQMSLSLKSNSIKSITGPREG